MNRLFVILMSVLMTSCMTTPKVVPLKDISHNIMAKSIDHNIGNNNTPITHGYSWLFWYIPVLFLVVVWGWRTFLSSRSNATKRSRTKTKWTANRKKKK